MMRKTRNMLLALIGSALFVSTLSAGEKGKRFEVKVIPDVAYNKSVDADPDKHKLDVYVPQGAKDYPTLFFIHGGGWRKGSRKSFAKLGKTFAGQGIAAVCTSYRLSPQVKHPAHIQDVARAFAWAHQNISKYGGRTDRIFASGHSAGGHLAALLATDGQYLEKHGLGLKNIKGVIPVSGVFEFAPAKRREAIFGTSAEVLRAAGPIHHVSKQCPPFLILYAEKDGKGFDKMAADFGDALKKNGVSAAVHEMKDRTHGTIVTNIPNAGDPTTRLMLEFIRQRQ